MSYYNDYQNNRYKTDSKFKLDRNIGRSIRRALKNSQYNRDNQWELILGYTIKDLKIRLLSTIPAGYTWQDYLDGKLELDHIIPVKVFKYIDISDSNFKKSWGLYNLRLLPKKIHRIKGGSLNSFVDKPRH